MLCRLKPARSIGRTSARRLCTARLPERVDAVVIGGGCVGSSVAYHLQPYYSTAARHADLVVPEIAVLKWFLKLRTNGSVNLKLNGRF